MDNLTFIQIEKGNEQHHKIFKEMMFPYNTEIDSHKGEITSDDIIAEITQGMINMQGPHDRHLEIAYCFAVPIGFIYGKVDHEGHKGFIKPGYGFIMEFYVKPEYRRQGYGTAMARHIEFLFANHGVKRMYLTADAVTGEPFWSALGFENTNRVSPENGQYIFEKNVDSTLGKG